MKEVIQMLIDLKDNKKTVNAIALEKIMEDIVDSFNIIQNN